MPLRPRRAPAGPVGVVLAGGEGRRLGGGGKAQVELLGRPLGRHALELLLAAGLREVAVVAKAATELPGLPAGAMRWTEPDAPRHPLTGLRYALRCSKGRGVVVLACDLPLVPPALLVQVAAPLPEGCRARVVRGQPLVGHYGPAALRPLEAAPPGARLTEVVAGLAPLLVEPLGVDDLHNVNTPEDLLAASALLSRRSRSSS